MSFITNFNAKLPFEVAVAGRKRNLLFWIFDSLFRWTTLDDVISTAGGPIVIDGEHAPERWLSYAFFNVLKYYENSDLGKYMSLSSGDGRIFIDIGANLGLYSIVARLHGYTTYLVEPEPEHATFLERNAATLGRVIKVALSDEPGSMPLYYNEKNSAATSLVSAAGYKPGEGVVSVVTFSSLVADGTFPDPKAIGLIKIDVEGAEAKMISGMRDFLDSGYRPTIWCEVRGDLSSRSRGSFRDVIGLLEPYGYIAAEFVGGVRREIGAIALVNRGVFDLLFEAEPA